jgi:citrate lyase beta subunit
VAVRINPVTSPEHALDLTLLKEIAPYIDDVMLAKAGEQHGITEVERAGGTAHLFTWRNSDSADNRASEVAQDRRPDICTQTG